MTLTKNVTYCRYLTMTKYIVAAYAIANMVSFNLFPVAMGAYIEEFPDVWKISVPACVFILMLLFFVAELIAGRQKAEAA